MGFAFTFAVAVPSASAAVTYNHLGFFGGAELSTNPNRIAVDSSTGNIYAADTGNNRVSVWAPGDCNPTCATSLLTFAVTAPLGIAVDPSNGVVYTTKAGANEVQTFARPAADNNLTFEGETTGATGTGNLSAATGTGNLSAATGTGSVTVGSSTVTGVNTTAGAFASGQTITGTVSVVLAAFPSNTTIVEVGEGTLTLSAGALQTGSANLVAGSFNVTGVNTTAGAFASGQTITGTGIPNNTTITNVGEGTLTISNRPTAPGGTGVVLSAGTNVVTGVSTGSGVFLVGQRMIGAGIPATARITAIDTGAGTITLSAPVTAPGTGTTLSSAIAGGADSTPGEVQAALEALPNVGPGNVTVGGTATRTVTFTGDLGSKDVAPIEVKATNGTLIATAGTTTGGAPGTVVRHVPTQHPPIGSTTYSADGGFTIPTLTGQRLVAGGVGTSTSPSLGGIAVDPASHDFFLTLGDEVGRFASTGAPVGTPFDGADSGQPFNIAADLAFDGNGDLIIADIAGAATTRVLRFSPGGAFQAALTPPPENPNAAVRRIAIAADPTSGAVFATSSPSALAGGVKACQYEADALFSTPCPAPPAALDFAFLRGLAASGTVPGRLYAVSFTGSMIVPPNVSLGTPRIQVFGWGPHHELSVDVVGVGVGRTVTSEPLGIECDESDGPGCAEHYDEGAEVELTASADAGFKLKAWTVVGSPAAACETPAPECVKVTMDDDVSVEAEFEEASTKSLSVEVDGTGEGEVTSTPTGIECDQDDAPNTPPDCKADFTQGSPVTLTADPVPPNSKFVAWSGPDVDQCNDSADPVCVVAMEDDRELVATFDTIQHEVSVEVGGNGSGTVGAVPGPIANCAKGPAGTCSGLYDQGSTFELTAVPAALSKLTGWSVSGDGGNDCTGVVLSCEVTVGTGSISISATFELIAPTVSNLPVGPRAQTTAVLNGTINNNGDPDGSDCSFEVADDAGFTTNLQSFDCDAPYDPPNKVTGAVAEQVSATATGLSPNTTYFYRVVAENSGGESKAAGSVEFKTLPNPPAVVVTAGATGISQAAATVAGTVNPNSGAVTACDFQYVTQAQFDQNGFGSALSQACNPVQPGGPTPGSSPVNVTAALSNLAANTTYRFRIVAENGGGPTEGTDQAFLTLPNPPTVFTDPEGALTQTSAVLNGRVDNKGAPAGSACSFEITLVSAPGGYGDGVTIPCETTPIVTADGVLTPVKTTISILVPKATYKYRVVAQNAGGAAVKGADEEFSTPPNPPGISGEAATGISQTAATLSGMVDNNGDPAGSSCEFKWGTTTVYSNSAPCDPSPVEGSLPVAVSVPQLTGLAPGTTYHFRIVAENEGGVAEGDDRTFTTLADTCATNASLCPPPVVAPLLVPPPLKTTPIKCRKGFKKGKVRGKVRCVKINKCRKGFKKSKIRGKVRCVKIKKKIRAQRGGKRRR